MRRRPRRRARPRRPPSPGRGAGSDERATAPCSIARRRPAPGSNPESSLRAEERRGRRRADVPPAAPAARLQASINGPPLQRALQRAQGAVLQRLDGTDTFTHDRSDLGGGQVLEEVEAGEAAGHGIDGQVLRVLGAPKAGVGIVVDAVEVALIKRADGVLVPLPHPLDEGAIVVGRRLSEWAHWVPLCTVPTWARGDEAPTNSRMVTF